MQKANPRNKITELFPQDLRVKINTAVDNGYDLAIKTVTKDASWLSEGRGIINLPRLKSLAVEFILEKMIDNGAFPWHYEIRLNKTRNHNYLCISSIDGTFHLTINQCLNGDKPANQSNFRNAENQNFQSYFDFGFNRMVTEPSLYLELNHGYQTDKPKFVMLGIPDENGQWYSAINLQNEFNILSNSGKLNTKESGPEEFNPNEFKKFVKKSKE